MLQFKLTKFALYTAASIIGATCVGVSIVGIASPAAADPAASFTLSSTDLAFNNVEATVVGWSFEVNSAISVGQLGYYDYALSAPYPSIICCSRDSRTGGGLLDNHMVGIYDNSTETLLTSVTIPAGTAVSIANYYRVAFTQPITLNPGVYTIAGTQQGTLDADPTDPVIFSFTNFTTIPRLPT